MAGGDADRGPDEHRTPREPPRRVLGPARAVPPLGRAARERADVPRARAEPEGLEDQEGAGQVRGEIVEGVGTVSRVDEREQDGRRRKFRLIMDTSPVQQQHACIGERSESEEGGTPREQTKTATPELP